MSDFIALGFILAISHFCERHRIWRNASREDVALRHLSPEMTRHYTDISNQAKAAAVATLGVFCTTDHTPSYVNVYIDDAAIRYNAYVVEKIGRGGVI